MRIISPFHDYYDSVQSLGVDLETMYHRTPRELSVSECPEFPNMYQPFGSPKWLHNGRIIVGFCGLVHPIVMMHMKGATRPCSSLEDVQEFCLPLLNKQDRTAWDSKMPRQKWKSNGSFAPLLRHESEQWLKKMASVKDKYGELFDRIASRVVVVHEDSPA
jgi:hypothetical protein